MNNFHIKQVTVIGSGTMGNGIAHVFALNGFQVTLTDINESRLNQAVNVIEKNLERQLQKEAISNDQRQQALLNIRTTTVLQAAVEQADLVVEAATENTELKLNLFKQIDGFAPAHCLLASNTSSISITKIAAATKRPSQVIGMHFMNPVPVMQLVEVINGFSTAEAVTKTVADLSRQLGKIPCIVEDSPGFIANRILMPMINEAICSLHERVAGVEEIDTIMKLGMAHPIGPLQLADFIGLDVCLSILNVLQDGFGNTRYAPCPLLVKMVEAGKLGVKSGEGFYVYEGGSKPSGISKKFI